MKPSLGILGGGQLSLMLSEAASRLGISTFILADKENDPVYNLKQKHKAQIYLKAKEENDFFNSCERILFENEFVNITELKQKTKTLKVQFYPNLDIIHTVQDKLKQKSLFRRLGLASSQFFSWDPNEQSLENWLRACDVGFGGKYVLKWSRFGYDGKGNLVVDKNISLKTKEDFIQRGFKKGAQIYAEEYVFFKKELAITAVHSVDGDLVTYPLVITEQDKGVCKWVFGPGVNFGVSEELQKQAEEYARVIAKGLQIIGCFAIEMFETENGKLLINEMAPRVHNSTHYSLDFSETSQFENHIRACAGIELGSSESLQKYFGMYNLLGEKNQNINREQIPDTSIGTLKWYGKDQSTPGRKLGHINFYAETLEKINTKKQEIIEFNRRWLDSF